MRTDDLLGLPHNVTRRVYTASVKSLATVLLLLVGVGCASFEHDLVQPPELRAHIGSKTDTTTHLDPLIYKWRTVDNRLVVRIFNPTNDSIELLGEKSTVVAPDGESHPVRSQTIAPQSHAKLILPPLRPRVYRPGPSFGVGVGMRVDSRRGAERHAAHAPPSVEPRYLAVYDGDSAYWDWRGETDVRLTLVYQRGDAPLRHEFTIHRNKK